MQCFQRQNFAVIIVSRNNDNNWENWAITSSCLAHPPKGKGEGDDGGCLEGDG